MRLEISFRYVDEVGVRQAGDLFCLVVGVDFGFDGFHLGREGRHLGLVFLVLVGPQNPVDELADLFISADPMPRVVTAGVPMRRPEAM